jgi:hypothetical protein
MGTLWPQSLEELGLAQLGLLTTLVLMPMVLPQQKQPLMSAFFNATI